MFEKICIIFLVNFIIYFRTLRYAPVSDDIPGIQHQRPFKNKWHKLYLQIFEGAKYNIPYDHLITLLIHSLVCVFIYLSLGKNDISFIAALLFSVNPVNNQGSIWISGRSYAITALLMLMAMSLPAISPLFLFISTYNPVGFFAPLAFIGSKYWWLVFVGLACSFYHHKRFEAIVKERREHEAVAEDKKGFLYRLPIAVKTYGFYFILAIIPFRLAWYHNFLESLAGNELSRKKCYRKDKFFWVGISVISFFILYSLMGWDNISWGLFWFSICIAPYLNIIRMQQEIAERYIYLANVGLMFVLANVIINYPVVITAFLIMYAIRLWYYMPAYTDDYWLVEYSVMEDPRSWFGWHFRGHKMLERGGIREALNMFVMAKLLSPREFKVLFNIGVVLTIMDKKEEAKKFFELAEKNIVEGQEEQCKKLFEEVRGGKTPLLL